MPGEPTQNVVGRRVEATGTGHHRRCPDIRHRFAVEIVPLHHAGRVPVAQRQDRVLQTCRIENDLLEQHVVRLVGRMSERRGKKIESEVRIESAAAGREEQGIGLQAFNIGLLRQAAERIIRRRRGTIDLARQARRMRRQVDQANRLPTFLGDLDRPAETILQTVGEPDLSLGDEAGEDLSGKGLGDRPDTHHRLAIGFLARSWGGFAKAENGCLPVANGTDHEAGNARIHEKYCAVEAHDFVEELVFSVYGRSGEKAARYRHGSQG